MNDFFSNLVDRHLGTCETIQPRTLGRFEADPGTGVVAAPDEGTNPILSESDQMLQEPSEAAYPWPKETVSEMNPLASPVIENHQSIDRQSAFSVDAPKVTLYKPDPMIPPLGEAAYPWPQETVSEMKPLVSAVVENHQPIDRRSVFSVDTPKATIHKSAPMGNKKNDLSRSLPEQSDASAPLGLTKQQAVLADSYETQRLDTDSYSHQGAMKQRQQQQTKKAVLMVDEHDVFSDARVQTNISEPHELTGDKPLLPTSRAGEHYRENELSHDGIGAMLESLMRDSVSPTTEPVPNDQGGQKAERLISIPPEEKKPLLDAAAASLGLLPSSEQQAGRQDSISADDRDNSDFDGRLEIPSWLPHMEAQFKQRWQDKEVKAEPVINVTIGRVEVRAAVQADVPKNAQRPKKPTGVMTLDEYLKRREVRGAR